MHATIIRIPHRIVATLVLAAVQLGLALPASAQTTADYYVPLSPDELGTGYPASLALVGDRDDAGTFDSGTTVTVHHYDLETSGPGDEIDGVVSQAVLDAGAPSHIEFSLQPGVLQEGNYIAVFDSAGAIGHGFFWVTEPSVWLETGGLYDGYSTPRPVTVSGARTYFDAADVTVTIHDYEPYWGVVGDAHPAETVGAVAVTDYEQFSFHLATRLPIGDYAAVITSGTDTFEAPFQVLSRSMSLDPDIVGANAIAPLQVTATGFGTTWHAETTELTLHEYDWDTGEGAEVTGMLGAPSVSASDTLAVAISDIPAAGTYIVRATTGLEIVDVFLTIAAPEAWAVPDELPVFYPTQTMYASGWFTMWAETHTTSVAIHPWSADLEEAGPEIVDQASVTAIDNREALEFTIQAGLDEGDYVARFASNRDGFTETVDAHFSVVAAAASLSPEYLRPDYATQTIDAFGYLTLWSETYTTGVAIHPIVDQETGEVGPAIEGAVGDPNLRDQAWIQFTLNAGLPIGEYVARLTTPLPEGAQVVDAPLHIENPSALVTPDHLFEDYASQTVNAWGWLTLWSETNTTQVSIHEVLDPDTGATGPPLPDAVDAATLQIWGHESLDITLNAGLPEGRYVARMASTTETVDAPFEVEGPRISVSPEYVENDWDEPIAMDVDGNELVDFESVSSPLVVEVFNSSGAPLEDVSDSVEVQASWWFTFTLTNMPDNGVYTVRVTVDDRQLEDTFEVGDPLPSIDVDPFELPVGYGSQLMTVTGEQIDFTSGPTTVSVREFWGEEDLAVVSSVEVSNATALTFQLDSLPEGSYEVIVQAGGQVLAASFRVARYAWAEPHQLDAGYDTPAPLTLHGFGTAWYEGTTVTVWNHDLWEEVSGAIQGLTVTPPATISVGLNQLPVGNYSFEIDTDGTVESALFSVGEPEPSITLDPGSLPSGHEPTLITVNGFHTAFESDTPTVAIWDYQESGHRPPSGIGEVVVSDPVTLTFQLQATLPDGAYDVEVTSGGVTLSAPFRVQDPPVPSAWLEPSWVFEGYGSQPMTLNGSHTGFHDPGSLLSLQDGDGNPVGDAISGVNVESTNQLTFDLGGNLEAGAYLLTVTTGPEIVEAWFWVTRPVAWLNPSSLTVDYPATPTTVEGWGTHWDEATTSIEIFGASGDSPVRTVNAENVDASTMESLQFTLDAGLGAGFYTVRTITGGEEVDAFLWITQPSITISPTGLQTGYAVPSRVDISGTATAFDSTTTVELLQGVSPVAAVGGKQVTSPWSLTFNLTQSLAAGTYTVRVATGEQVLTAPLVVATPKAQLSSTSGSTSVKEDGTVTVTMPTGSRTSVVVERDPTCPEGQSLDGATVHHNGHSYAMSQIALGGSTWRATIPADDLAGVGSTPEAKAITMTVTCGGVESDEETLGEIVLYDPSGIVSDSVSGDPIEGATVTLYKVPGWLPRQFPGDETADTCESHLSKDAAAPWSQEAPTELGIIASTEWDPAQIDPVVNPQTTSSIGYYGWNVAQGCWYVTVSAPGYDRLVSPVVGVPPEVTDLDLELVPDSVVPTWGGGAVVTPSELTETSVKLSWPEASDNEAVTAYRIYQIDDAVRPAADTLVATTTLNERSKTLTGLKANRRYTFRVVAVDVAGNEGAGLQKVVTTPDVTAPTWTAGSVSASNLTDTSVKLSWSTAKDNDAVKGYRVYQEGVQVADLTTRSRTVTGLDPETTYTFTVEAYDHKGNESTTGPTGDVTTLAVVDTSEPGEPGEPAEPGEVTRQSGLNRFETAVEISKASFGAGVPVAYIAFGHNFPDALAGGPAAAKNGGPILLVDTNVIPEATRQELARLVPGTIVILGGESAVSLDVERELAGFTAGRVWRIAGNDRYETAASISKANYEPGVPVVYVATGEKFPDALAGGAAAVRDGGPVLLVKSSEIPISTATELARLKPGRIVVLGGESAVSASVASQLAAYTTGAVDRLWGTGRYETAAAILGTFAPGVDTVYVATGGNFPDALAGVPAAGLAGAPIVLLPGDSIPEVIAAQLRRLAPRNIVILGGDAVIGPLVMMSLGGYLAG